MCMETRAAVSSFTPEGKLTMLGIQPVRILYAGPYGRRPRAMREGDIRVLAPYVGGGFGGKFELDGAIFCSAILSMKLFRPVKICLYPRRRFYRFKATDPDVLLGTDRRIKKTEHSLPVKPDVVSNGGAYTGMGATALYLTGFFHSFPYKWGGYRYDGYRVYTNTLPSTSMRGFGAPQAMFCSEQQIEWICARPRSRPD